MALPTMAFDPVDGFRNEVTYADPVDTAAAREQIQGGLDQLRDFINNDLKQALSSNANGEGASQIGVEDAGSKFTATNVETILLEIANSLATKANKAQEAWTAPTLQNSWTSTSAGYRKDEFNEVELKGIASSGTVTKDTVLFNLPVGYRPSTARTLPSTTYTTTTVAACALVVNTNGNVSIGAVNAATNISFDTLRFSLD